MARCAYLALKILRRNGSHSPGVIAAKICPKFLWYIGKPDTVVAIMGTNGKTTTTNLINSYLDSNNISYVSNFLGSNILGGINSALLTSTSFWGKNKEKIGIFEVDEKASLQIYPDLTPDIIAITNLFRDSYRRNAHIEYIKELLEESIPSKPLIITNADDLVASNLVLPNRFLYFSLAPQKDDIEVKDSLIQDVVYCPECGEKLDFMFQRYHHIGKVKCVSCGYTNKPADFLLTTIGSDTISIEHKGKVTEYPKIATAITDTYNELTAISVLTEMGYPTDKIQKSLSQINVVDSRYTENIIGDKRIITIIGKDQNPVANSRVFDYIRKGEHWGNTTVVFMNEDDPHSSVSSEVANCAWLYDADFEYLNQDFITHIYCMGRKTQEYENRLIMAGYPKEKITQLAPSHTLMLDWHKPIDTIVLITDVTNIQETATIRDEIIKRFQNEN